MTKSRRNLVFDTRQQGLYLILNPLSGAVDLFDSRALALLDAPDSANTEQRFADFYRYCRERGYLYDSIEDEILALGRLHDRAMELYRQEPLRVHVYPTFLCNLRCTYCFQDRRLHDGDSLMEADVVDSLFEAVSELTKRRGNGGRPILTLFGGEPLLKRKSQRDAIEHILRLGRQRDCRLRIITNGVELAAYADTLARYGVEFVQVTLDGPQHVHDARRVFADGRGSFTQIVKGIDEALARALPVAIRVNVDTQNVRALPELADFILGKGWIDRGVVVGAAPVNEFVPETEWCTEQTQIDTLMRLLEVKRSHPQMGFMAIACRLVEFFEELVEKGRLPLPAFRHCPAAAGNQISLDFRGNIFVCC